MRAVLETGQSYREDVLMHVVCLHAAEVVIPTTGVFFGTVRMFPLYEIAFVTIRDFVFLVSASIN